MPLTVQLIGMGLAVPSATTCRPNVAVWPGATCELYDTLVSVTTVVLAMFSGVTFHACPATATGNVSTTVHLAVGLVVPLSSA